jgi:hypothetical protein
MDLHVAMRGHELRYLCEVGVNLLPNVGTIIIQRTKIYLRYDSAISYRFLEKKNSLFLFETRTYYLLGKRDAVCLF